MTVIADALSEATRYLRVLHSVERAFAIGSEDELVSLLSGVDPVELLETTSIIQTLALFFEDSRDDPTGTSVATPQSAVPATTPQSPERSSSSRVTFLHEPPAHPGWSVRCS